MSKCKFLIFVSLILAVAIIPLGIDRAAAAPPLQVDPTSGYYWPDYYTTPNWAFSQPLTKFVDDLPGLHDPRTGPAPARSIPLAVPDVVTYPGSDYYELELRQYTQVMHSELPATTLRGYVQVNSGTTDLYDAITNPTGCVAMAPIPAGARLCTPTDNTITPADIRYLGPVIVAQKDRPIRIKFKNALLPADGPLFVPVDTSIMGSGTYDINYDPVTKLPTATKTGSFSTNRATIHLHGGRNPWISDGTAHQWTNPALEPDPNGYSKGVSVAYVPDMWFDAAGQMITETTYPGSNCAGQTTCAVAGATNNPGAGSLTFFWTNKQSSRMMFYHDHAYGITRLNVYAGEAAGYLLQDPVELALINGGTVNGRTFPALLPAVQIPLVFAEKTFVDGNSANPTYVLNTDPTWAWGTQPGKPIGTPVTGDLWWPHVYMPAENPYNPNLTGLNDFGRWVYSPWFFPPVPVCGTGNPPAAKPWCIDVGPLPNPYAGQPGQSPIIPGTPIPSVGAEAFMDTVTINGAAYPKLSLPAGKYRFRILNANHDRFLNLQWYQATPGIISGITNLVGGSGYTSPPSVTFTGTGTGATATATIGTGGAVTAITIDTVGSGYTIPTTVNISLPPAGGTAATADATVYTAPTEVGMVTAPDGRVGGIPDPAKKGPAWIQIGSEGGFLPKPVVLPNQPVMWNTDPTMFNVGNVLQQNEGGGTLFLGCAERADVIVDFTNYGGKTLILYNDAPTAFPALVQQYNYFTGAPDNTGAGGYGPIGPGVGPNIRTLMQVNITGAAGTPTGDDYDPILLADLEAAFATDATGKGAFAASQEDIIVGQGLYTDPANNIYGTDAYNTAYNTTFSTTPPYWGIYSDFSTSTIGFQDVTGANVTIPLTLKAMHDEMGGTFDDFGRMSAKLGIDNPAPNAGNANFIMQQFVDGATEITTPGNVQIWRINHNGVDTHPIHFHLFEVQVINRIGWDGFVRLPDPNELGWKDTVRISPLEDTILALRPVLPVAPWPEKIPNSVRPLNPTTPLGSTDGFSQINVVTGNPLVPLMGNQMINFGWEYTWHCHILSHEENDMMRPIAFAIAPAVPTLNPTTLIGNGNNRSVVLNWTPGSLNATNFTVQRATNVSFTNNLVTYPLGNVTTYTNPIGNPNQTFYYRVLAANTVGGPAPYPIVPVNSGNSNISPYPTTAPLAAPAEPAPLTTAYTPQGTNPRVTLTWTNVANESGYRIQRALNPSFGAGSGLVTNSVGANVTTFTTGNLSHNVTYYFRVQAFNSADPSAWANQPLGYVSITTP